MKFTFLAAVTLDGKIGRHKKHFTDWTSREDKDFLRQTLDKSEVIIVGNNTFKTAKEFLLRRNCVVFTRSVDDVKEKTKTLVYLNPEKTSLKKYLIKKNYKKIIVLGGEETFTYCLEKKLIDEIYLTIEPIVFGRGLSLFKTKKFEHWNFELVSVKQLNKKPGSLLLRFIRT